MPFQLIGLGGLAKGLLARGAAKLAARGGRQAARAAIGGGSGSTQTLLRSIPGAGIAAAAAGGAVRIARRFPGTVGAVGGAIVGYLADGTPVMGKKRRGRGFSSRDIRQTKRMFRLICNMQDALKGIKKRC